MAMLAKAGRFEEKTLRVYQADCTNRLYRKIVQGGKREFLVESPTGSGKSLITQAALWRLIESEAGIFSLVVAPQVQIEESFSIPEGVEGKAIYPPNGANGIKHIPDTEPMVWHKDAWIQLRQESGSDGKEYLIGLLKSRDPDQKVAVSTHQALAAWAPSLFKALPGKNSLKGRFLVIDEAHRVGGSGRHEKNTLTQIRDQWLDHGGSVIYLTATPFRDRDTLHIPEDVERFRWSLADHIAAGYSPQDIKMRAAPLASFKAAHAEELEGSTVPLSVGSSPEIVKLWVNDGRPKAIIDVPIKNSKRWAHRLKGLFEKAGARVLMAVGTDRATKTAFLAAMKKEREDIKRGFGHSQYDVILACKRFDEGTDWAVCSHVYNIGLTWSFKLIIQRLGRALRDKREIEGYPARFAQEAHFVFLVPTANDHTWAEYDKQHKDRAFLLACFMEDIETAQIYGGSFPSRLEDAARKRGSYQKAEDVWGDVIEATKLNHYECVQAAKLIGMAEGILKLKSGKPMDTVHPTIGEVLDYLKTEKGLKGKGLQNVRRVLVARLTGSNNAALRSLTTRVTNAVLGKNPEQINAVLRKVFREVIEEHKKDVCPEAFERAVKHHCKFTGKTIQAVSRDLAEKLRISVEGAAWNPTPEQWKMITKAAIKNGRIPPKGWAV